MIQTMSNYEIINALKADEFARWSYEECIALADYYESLEDDMGEPIEFDRVSIRCEWGSYDSLSDIIKAYGGCPDNWYLALEWLKDRTDLVQLEHSILIREF
jgi:hypothetical protein